MRKILFGFIMLLMASAASAHGGRDDSHEAHALNTVYITIDKDYVAVNGYDTGWRLEGTVLTKRYRGINIVVPPKTIIRPMYSGHTYGMVVEKSKSDAGTFNLVSFSEFIGDVRELN
jgi:hypothetical protein